MDCLFSQYHGTLWHGGNRSMVHSRFCDDMSSRCAELPWWEGPECEGWALEFYSAVKNERGLPGYNTAWLPPYEY